MFIDYLNNRFFSYPTKYFCINTKCKSTKNQFLHPIEDRRYSVNRFTCFNCGQTAISITYYKRTAHHIDVFFTFSFSSIEIDIVNKSNKINKEVFYNYKSIFSSKVVINTEEEFIKEVSESVDFAKNYILLI